MEKLGINVDQQTLFNIFQAVDKDGSGDLNYKEFSTGFFQDELQVTGDNRDPYILEKNRQSEQNQNARKEAPEQLLHLFRDKLKARGSRGMIGLKRLFAIMDDDGTQSLSLPEFIKAVKDFRIGISEENVPVLFQRFDYNGDGTLNFQEFLDTVRGPFPQQRQALAV
jgi:Ca2+-binding EF-hand superfamily protein